MAIAKLRTNYKDDIINTEINNKRRYMLENNSDGSISLEDVTTYEQIGSNFGAQDINSTNGTINNVIDSLAEVSEQSSKDFILVNQATLNFTGNTCILNNEKITDSSLADVYFTSDTIPYAEEAGISVETISGAVIISAVSVPASPLRATIHIRVV